MLHRVLVIAENTLMEFRGKGLLLALFGACLFVIMLALLPSEVMGSLSGSRNSLSMAVLMISPMFFFFGLVLSVFYAAGLVEEEVTKRTIVAVMIRPVHRWEYVLGRGLGAIAYYTIFILMVTLLFYSVIWFHGAELGMGFPLSIAQRLFQGAGLILAAASLGSILSSRNVKGIFVLVFILSSLLQTAPLDDGSIFHFLKTALFYITPAEMEVGGSFFLAAQQVSRDTIQTSALIALENLLYGIAVFIVCAWIFQRRDTKTGEGK